MARASWIFRSLPRIQEFSSSSWVFSSWCRRFLDRVVTLGRERAPDRDLFLRPFDWLLLLREQQHHGAAEQVDGLEVAGHAGVVDDLGQRIVARADEDGPRVVHELLVPVDHVGQVLDPAGVELHQILDDTRGAAAGRLVGQAHPARARLLGRQLHATLPAVGARGRLVRLFVLGQEQVQDERIHQVGSTQAARRCRLGQIRADDGANQQSLDGDVQLLGNRRTGEEDRAALAFRQRLGHLLDGFERLRRGQAEAILAGPAHRQLVDGMEDVLGVARVRAVRTDGEEQKSRGQREGADGDRDLLHAQLAHHTGAANRGGLVREHHVGEHVTQEVALGLGDRHRRRPTPRDPERAGHALHDAVDGATFLRARGEVHATQNRRILVHVLGEQVAHQGRQIPSEAFQLLRELEDLVAGIDPTLVAQARESALADHVEELLQLLLEDAGALVRAGDEREGHAPDLAAFLVAQIAEHLHEARHEV